MSRVRRLKLSAGSTVPALLGALLLAAVLPAGAQRGMPVDTISGRVVAADSAPIAARVSAEGDDGRVFRTQADSAGRYLLAIPGGSGIYNLTAEAFGYIPFLAAVQRPAGGGRIVRDLRLNPRVVELESLVVTAPTVTLDVRQGTPGETFEAFGALTAEGLPVEPGDLADLAALAPGVVRLGDEEGLSIAGQAPSQNRTTVDGATYSGGRLPAEGVRSVATLTNTYDVSHGRFSGGEIAARTISGTNLWGGALTARLKEPWLTYGSLPGDAFGQRDRRFEVSAGGGGALVRDRLFVYGAADLSRTRGLRPFLNLDDAAALRLLGVAADSARRFAGIANTLGLSPEGAADARRDYASALARVDYTLSDRHSLTARLDWRGSRSSGLGASPLRLAASSGEQRRGEAGVLAQFTSGWGLWANDLRVYHSRGEESATFGTAGPVGRVRVSSTFDDGTAGISSLNFGGVPFLFPEGEHFLWEMADELTYATDDGAHRFKAGVLLQEERSLLMESQNRYGTFTFSSLGDLERNRPVSFTRTLPGEYGEATHRYAALYLGDTWRPSEELALIYGLRLEGSRYGERSALDSLSGSHSRGVPSEIFLSPRLGFSYKVPGQGDMTVRGGIGAFRGTVPLRSLASVWNETGTGESRLLCIGPATPTPDWRAYAADPAAIPSVCADGTSVFADRAPSVTLFGPGFAAPRTWRASLGVDGTLAKRLSYQTGALLVRGERLPTAVDGNLDTHVGFGLPGEAGRPVFVEPDKIDPGSGGIAPDASRLLPTLGIVRELGARGESWTGQLTAGLIGVVGKNTLVAFYYALTRSRDRIGGIAAPGALGATTAADPSRLEWAASDFDRRHSFQLILSDRIHPHITISAIGQLGSGLPFTPLVAGDVNGDGALNDRAFIFAPESTTDASVALGVDRLLETAPSPVRDCLRRQLGSIAERNSCRTPWWSSLNLKAEFVAPGFARDRRRLIFTLTASNVTAGLDYLLHGADDLRGWGQYRLPDATLLETRGFDPDSRAYRYEANPRFGQPLGNGLLRIPFQLVLQGRLTVGADPRYQPMANLVASTLQTVSGPEEIRAQLAERIRNVPALVLGLDAEDPGVLALTPDQTAHLKAAAESLAPRIDSALDSLAEAFAQRGPMTAARRARVQEGAREAQAIMDAALGAARQILTPTQWEKLPVWLTNPSTVEELQRPPSFEVTLPGGAP